MGKKRPRTLGCFGVFVLGIIVFGIIGAVINAVQTSYFSKHREEIIGAVRADLAAERYDAVIATAEKYSMVGDPELEKLRDEAEREKKQQQIEELRAEIANATDLTTRQQKLERLLELVPDDPEALQMLAEALRTELDSGELSDYRKKQVLEELTTLQPHNETWKGQLSELTTEIQRHERIEQQKKNRDQQIERQFSGWDGSHSGLVKRVKQQMNDPDSFKHVDTKRWDMGNHLIVSMTFRGKNAFGGTVTNTVKAKVSLDGSQIEILEMYQ